MNLLLYGEQPTLVFMNTLSKPEVYKYAFYKLELYTNTLLKLLVSIKYARIAYTFRKPYPTPVQRTVLCSKHSQAFASVGI